MMNNDYINKCNNKINNYYELLSYSNKFKKKKNNNNNHLISIFNNINIFNINKNINSHTNFKKNIKSYINEITELKNTIIVGDYIFKNLINNDKEIYFFTLNICFYNISKKQLNNNINNIIQIVSKNYEINTFYNDNNILLKTNINYDIKICLNKYKSLINIIKKQNLFNKFIYDGHNVYTNHDGHNLIINNFNNITINKYDLIKYKEYIKKYKITISSFNDYVDIKYIYSNKLIKNNLLIYKNNSINKEQKKELHVPISDTKKYNFLKHIKKTKSKDLQLLSIIKNDSLEKMKELIVKEHNIINYKFNILNLIHLVCRFNSKNILHFLLNINNKLINNLDNLYNIHPIFISIICNNFDIFKILWNNKLLNKKVMWIIGDNIKKIYNILDLCIILDRINFVKFLINKNIKIKRCSYNKCIEYNNYNMLKILNIVDINIFNKIEINKMSMLSKSITKLKNNVEQRKIIIYLIENGIKLEYDDNIQPLNQIVELNDIPLLNFFIKNNVNINCVDNKNMNCLDIVNKQRNELLKIIFNKKEKINFDIWNNKIVKKYTFLIKELYEYNKKNNNNTNININEIRKKLNKLKEIEELVIKSNGHYNNKINFFYKKRENNIFNNIDIEEENNLLSFCENIYKKNLFNIRKFINNRSDILYYDIQLFYTKKNIFHLIIESNLDCIFEDLLNVIIDQCNKGFYYDKIINKNLNNIFKINNNNKLTDKNSYLLYCYLINDILLTKYNDYNIIELCIINKSYECLEFLLNKKDFIPEQLIYKHLYNLKNLLLTIEYNKSGLFIMIFEKIKENIINNKKELLFKIIEEKTIKILHYINKKYNDFFNLEIKDDNDNNLFHYLLDNNNDKIEDIFKYLYDKIPDSLYNINKSDISPLYKLTKIKNINLLKIMIDNGINLYDYDYLGYNVIHYSIMNNNIEFIDFLIKKYNQLCCIATKYENISPLMLCVITNNKIIYDKLLKNNKINKTDIYGNTIYHYIAMYSRLNFIYEYDIKKISNKLGILPEDYAFYKLLNSLYTSNNLEESLNFYNHINPKKLNKINLLNKKKINKLIKYYIKDKNNATYILKNN
jgi:hypothetical protein